MKQIMSSKETLIRVYWVYFLVLFLAAGVVSRIFYLQFYEGAQLQLDAEKQIFVSKNISAPRGNI
jgi:cell division protein FtsI/penicillin-binding protein 2